jgi:hypothetical protein
MMVFMPFPGNDAIEDLVQRDSRIVLSKKAAVPMIIKISNQK